MSALKILETNIDHRDLPRPTGYTLLIEPVRVEQTSRGGIVLADETVRHKEILQSLGRVVAMGPCAYQGKAEFDRSGPWCEVGDFILHPVYGGQEVQVQGKDGKPSKLRIINDDQVLALVPNPEAIIVGSIGI